MKLQLVDQRLVVHLSWQERLWAFHLSPNFSVALDHIQRVSTERPMMEWYALRAPGTGIPGLLTAGTFYTPRGREFWYVTRNSDFLVLDADNEYYKRIVVTLHENQTWARAISQSLVG